MRTILATTAAITFICTATVPVMAQEDFFLDVESRNNQTLGQVIEELMQQPPHSDQCAKLNVARARFDAAYAAFETLPPLERRGSVQEAELLEAVGQRDELGMSWYDGYQLYELCPLEEDSGS